MEKLRELNPYVRIDCLGGSEAEFKGQNDLESFLKNFNCVILTELRDLDVLLNVNSLCRKNRIHFLLSDVYGLFGFSFTDFGADYETIDTDGEEYRDMFISKISSEDEACVEVLDQHAHNLEVKYIFFIEYYSQNFLKLKNYVKIDFLKLLLKAKN